jgi:Mg-chelatase subunit ChlD
MGKFLVQLVLDESGSMHPQRNDVIGGVNNYIEGLRTAAKETGDEYRVSLTRFDSGRTPWVRHSGEVQLADFRALDNDSYAPMGGTPLLDAVGGVLTRSRPAEGEDVLTVIFTDGEENQSLEWSLEAVRAAILEHEARGETFLYLAQGPGAWAGRGALFAGTQSYANAVHTQNFTAAADAATASTQTYSTGYGTGTRTVVGSDPVGDQP